MALEDVPAEAFFRNLFKSQGNDFDGLVKKFGDPFTEYCRFYYWICRPDQQAEGDIRDELRIIGVTSLIEALMTAFPGTHKSNKQTKIRTFFAHFYADGKEVIKESGFERLGSGFSNLKITDPIKVADIIYGMRNEFVHEAKMHGLKPGHVDWAGMSVQGEAFDIRITMNEFLRNFEASYVRYWTADQGFDSKLDLVNKRNWVASLENYD